MTAPVIANPTTPVGIVLIDPATGLPYSAAGGGVAISAGTNSSSSGTVVFSNSNGVTFGMSPAGVVTATVTPGAAAGIAAVQLSNTTYTSGTVNFVNSNGVSFGSTTGGGVTASYTVPGATVFSNSNNVSFGLAGSTVTATATFAGGVSGGVSTGGNTSGNTGTYSGQFVLAGGNNITLSVSSGAAGAQTITISGANVGGAQTGISGVQVSNTTYTSGTVNFQNANGISFGSSGANGISASYTVPTQTNQTVGLYGVGNTTQNSSTTLDARTLSFDGLGAMTVGYSNGSIQLSSPPSSLGVSTGGNTSGNTGTFSGQMVLAGGNNITLSVATAAGGAQTITISGANAGGAQTGISGVVVSNTTYTSGTVSFSNANGISFGSSAGQAITASYTVPTQSNQTLGLYASSQTTAQSSSSTIDARSLTVVGQGIISAGLSGGSLIISAPATTGLTQLSAGMSTGGNTVGTTGLASAQLVLAGGTNITLSGSTNAGSMTITVVGANAGSVNFSAGTTSNNLASVVFSNSNGVSFGLNGSTITGSVAAQTNQTVGLYGVGNTTQNSSTTLDARTMSFDGLGAMTVGFSNGSVQLSAPATSSISVTGQLSLSVNASTISIGAPNYGTLSYWDNGILNGSATTATLGVGSVVLQAMVLDEYLSMSALREFISGSFSSSSNSSYAIGLSLQAGLYTLNGSTLSQASSGSQSYAFTNTSNNSFSVLTGIKGVTIPMNASMTPGNYWIGLWSSTSSANANWATLNNVVANEGALTYNGMLGSATSASNQVVLGGGVWSTTSANLPSSVGLSHITGSVANNVPYVNLYNVSA